MTNELSLTTGSIWKHSGGLPVLVEILQADSSDVTVKSVDTEPFVCTIDRAKFLSSHEPCPERQVAKSVQVPKAQARSIRVCPVTAGSVWRSKTKPARVQVLSVILAFMAANKPVYHVTFCAADALVFAAYEEVTIRLIETEFLDGYEPETGFCAPVSLKQAREVYRNCSHALEYGGAYSALEQVVSFLASILSFQIRDGKDA